MTAAIGIIQHMPINNTVIKQLSDQAKSSVPHGLGVDKWIDTYNELFAELIVKECANYITEYYPHSRYEAFYMKKHFGVEE